MRFYLGVGMYTPKDAIAGEMGWKPTSVCQWKSVCSYWAKLTSMNTNRLNKQIALWAASVLQELEFFNLRIFNC